MCVNLVVVAKELIKALSRGGAVCVSLADAPFAERARGVASLLQDFCCREIARVDAASSHGYEPCATDLGKMRLSGP